MSLIDPRDDRGVSDTLAYVLTFSVVISSVGLVAVGGMGTLEDVRDGARANTAQVSMESLGEALDDVRTDGAPRRMIELRLNGDGLYLRDSAVRVDVGRENGTYENQTVDVGAFARRTGSDTDVVYASGGVYRQQRGGSTVVATPPVRCGDDTAHVSLVAMSGNVDIASGGTVSVEMSQRESVTHYPAVATNGERRAQNLTVNVTQTEYREAWERVFESELAGWTEQDDGVYHCDGIRYAVVHETRVELRAIA